MKNSIYLFFGEEDFLIDENIKRIKAEYANPSTSIETLDGGNLTPELFSGALQTSPLLGEEKLVIVRDFKPTAENQDQIIAAIRNIPSGVQVIFQADDIDSRSKLYKLINEAGEAVEFKTFAPWEQYELCGWIKEEARRQGKKMTDAAARLLSEISGSNLRQLSSEIAKIAAYTGERQEIGEDDVSKLALPGEANVFSLLDALRNKDLKGALSVFQPLLRNKEDFFQLMHLLSTQYRLLLQIKSLSGKEKDHNKIARQVGGSPFFVKKCLEKAHNFSLDELKRDMEKLLETNLKMKTGESQTILFEELLTSLCGA